MRRLALGAAVALPLFSAATAVAGQEENPMVDRAWARATPGAATVGAAYFRIQSATDDRLVGIFSPVAGKTELHDHVEQNGLVLMERIDGGLPIKAGQAIELRSGGIHVMLVDLKVKLRAGDRIPITLSFEKAGRREVIVKVEPLGARGPSEEAGLTGQGIGKRPAALGTPQCLDANRERVE